MKNMVEQLIGTSDNRQQQEKADEDELNRMLEEDLKAQQE